MNNSPAATAMGINLKVLRILLGQEAPGGTKK